MASNEETSLDRVKAIVASELGISVEEVSPMLGLYAHPRWDSITHVNILLCLEKECGLILTDRIADELTTVQQLANSIRGTS